MSISLTQIGTFDSGIFDDSAAEIVAFDPVTNRAFVVNGALGRIDVLDVADPSNPVQDAVLPFISFPASFAGRAPTSVAVSGGLLAVAMPNDPETDAGDFWNATAMYRRAHKADPSNIGITRVHSDLIRLPNVARRRASRQAERKVRSMSPSSTGR